MGPTVVHPGVKDPPKPAPVAEKIEPAKPPVQPKIQPVVSNIGSRIKPPPTPSQIANVKIRLGPAHMDSVQKQVDTVKTQVNVVKTQMDSVKTQLDSVKARLGPANMDSLAARLGQMQVSVKNRLEVNKAISGQNGFDTSQKEPARSIDKNMKITISNDSKIVPPPPVSKPPVSKPPVQVRVQLPKPVSLDLSGDLESSNFK